MTHAQLIWTAIGAIGGGLTAIAAWVGAWPVISSWIKSFDPVVAMAAPTLGSAPGGQLTVLLYMNVSNKSESSGCVRDLRLSLDRVSDKHSLVLFPVFVVDVSEYFKLVEEKKTPLTSVKRMFSPYQFSGSGSVEETLIFMHRPASESPDDIFKVGDLKSDQYEMEVSILKTDSSCSAVGKDYSSIDGGRISFTLTADNISQLQGGGVVTVLEESLDRIRRKAVRGG